MSNDLTLFFYGVSNPIVHPEQRYNKEENCRKDEQSNILRQEATKLQVNQQLISVQIIIN